MSDLSFPPRSILRGIKKVRVKVILQGDTLVLIDEVIKQLVGGALSNAGNSIERVPSSDESFDATLHCHVSAISALTDEKDRPLGQVYCLNFYLVAPVVCASQTELVIAWNKVEYGFTEAKSLYSVITGTTQKWSAELVEELLASQQT